MIAEKDYKYTHYTTEEPSLFNLQADPLEMDDLAANPAYRAVRDAMEQTLHSVVDPDATSYRAKKSLGFIGPDGEDYTRTLTVTELEEGRRKGRFAPEPARM